MMRAFIWLFVCAFETGSLADSVSALSALKTLPPGDAKNLAWIEGREGNPVPDHWYLIVYDPMAESGLREYVVQGKKVLVARMISQFAGNLKREDVFTGEPVRVDSGHACAIARQLAEANNVVVAKFNYQLRRPDPGAAPVWTIACLDDAGEKIGTVTILASDGMLIANSGFTRTLESPPLSLLEKKRAALIVAGNKPDADALENENLSRASPAERKRKKDAAISRATTKPSDSPDEPVGEKRRTPLESIGQGLHRIFNHGN